MKHIYTTLKFIQTPLMIATLLLGMSSNAWGKIITPWARVNVSASPSDAGYVYVGTSKNCSSNSASNNTDYGENSGQLANNDGNVYFWLCAKPKDGYSHAGWKKSGDETIISGSTADPYKLTVNGGDRDRSGSFWTGYTYTVRSQYTYDYVAVFTPKTYKINFFKKVGDNANGGTAWKSLGVKYKETYGSCEEGWPEPERDGYTFAGWYKSDGTTKVVSTDIYNNTSNIALYGHWTSNYEVKFDGTDKTSGTMDNQKFTYTEEKALTANAYERKYAVTFDADGGSAASSITATYTFNGWHDETNNKDYTDKQKVKDLTTTVKGVVTLTAKWTSASITLPSTSRTGYVFEGWYNGETMIGNAGASYTPTAGITLKAKWTKIETPVFKLNGTDIAENGTIDAELNLLIGEKANMAFENIDANFTYPTSTTEVKYTHNASAKTGEIEALAAGSATFVFNQPEATYIYAHARTVKVNVSKHPVTLTTTMNNTVCEVFTVFNLSDIYTLTTPAGVGDPAQNEITVTSSNTSAIAFEDGKWRAVGAGTTTLTIAQIENDYWTGDTITATVTVNKIDPSITPSISAAAITYGQPLSASNITGTVAVSTPAGSENAATTCTWENETSILDAGDRTATVVFQSAHTNWFNAVEIADVPVKVNPANPTIATAATAVEGQTLGEIVFANNTTGVGGESVTGTIALGNDEDGSQILSEGNYNITVKFTSSNSNYNDGTLAYTLTVQAAKTFQGTTNEAWGTGSNWADGSAPTATDRVVINADAEVTGTVDVYALTINENKTVTVKDGGVLNIGNGNSLTRETYGNIIVEAGGQLNLGGGQVRVNDLTLFSNFDDDNNPKSGQVTSANKLTAHGDAYFILDLDSAGVATYGWYGFTVPFPVDALHGIARYDNGEWKTMVNEKDYAIMDYHEDLRAQGKYGWKKYRGVLQPGTGYILSVDDELLMNRCRFKMAEGGSFNTEMTQSLTASGDDEINKGWNSIGNGTLTYVSYESTPRYAQLLDHKNNVYRIIQTNSNSFVVGAAYFVQALDNSTLQLHDASSATTGMLRAPQREHESAFCSVNLSLRTAGQTCDNMFVTCDDDASATYTIGKDVQKMGATTGAAVARMWAKAKGTNLGAVDVAYSDNKAIVPLSIYAPKAGEYTLSADNEPTEDVYLTRDGIIVWDLGMSEYTLDMNAGTDDSYALLVVRRVSHVATGVEQTTGESNRGTDFVEKMIVNGQLFILRDGQLYDAQGKKVTTL